MAPEPVIVNIACDVCAEPCAGFELLPPGAKRTQGPDHPAWDIGEYRIYCWNFEREGDSEISQEEFELMSRVLQDRDFAGLSDINWRHTIFWCESCTKCYCIDHWRIEYDDDDPMCSEYGTCPNGHGKILDD